VAHRDRETLTVNARSIAAWTPVLADAIEHGLAPNLDPDGRAGRQLVDLLASVLVAARRAA